ncbi:hypothetical protein C0V82_26045 (plasmid) [Niveispirillum cyanobacteriorum]|uniref:Uncharacterized protein n=1 Tax=Niveispirillum cyanobacteriorum TaxID=1612173 RepID=A0A2K9NLG8_9PROT|nr:hypothetical protein C0V82_26045 [Niveispirillum cyanobacteriorum]
MTFKMPADFKGAVVETAFHDYDGFIDGIRKGKLCGWVWNRCLPDERVLVSLYDGLVHVGDTLATDFRNDLKQAGKANGHCAFSIDLPLNMLDGAMHSLSVRVHGTTWQLVNSPMVFGLNSASGLADMVVKLQQDVAKLSQMVNALFSVFHITDLDSKDKSMPEVGNDAGKNLVDALMKRTEALLTIQREALEQEMRVLAAEKTSISPTSITKVDARHGRLASALPDHKAS